MVRLVLPNSVRVGRILAKKDRSLKIRWTTGKTQVLPNARMYWAYGKTPSKDEYLELAPKGAKSEEPKRRRTTDDLMSVSAAEQLFGVKGKDIRRWLRSGKVQGFQGGSGSWSVSSQSLGQFLAERR